MTTSIEETGWRDSIFSQLQLRNRTQTYYFQELILSHNKLFENADALRNENLQLSLQNEKLRIEAITTTSTSGSGSGDSRLNERIQYLEQKLLAQQEELTELHRRKGENAQQLIDLNIKVQEKEKLLASKEVSLSESMATAISLRAEIRMYENSIKELQNLNQTIRDEHQALQLAFASLEEKLRKAQDENRQLLERIIHYKTKDAEKMNIENDNFLRKKNAKVQKELEDACKDSKDLKSVSMDDFPEDSGSFLSSSLPTKVSLKFDAHEGEVNAVKWGPDHHIVATGGADRKVRLWHISKGSYKTKGSLDGSNAAVMAIDFDSTGTLILGASNDYASRVWSIAEQRLRHTFTGHSAKVWAAKFLDQTKIVTGSYDRTLKIWDLRSRACIETKFAGSSCNDLVTIDSAGSTIISGHFDKRIRFWDTRSDSSANEIVLQGKVTSLDLSRDSNYLISCVRDDTLKLIDLRMNQIVLSFSSDGFKVGCDWARATFSPDGQYVSVGSADGSVYIWGINTAKVETVLKDPNGSAAVTATSWNPFGSQLISVDRSKCAIVWGDC